MRLSPGTPAPQFEATDWTGKQVRLLDYRGQRLWLAFFRYAACPLCNLRVHDLITRYDALSSQGLDILAVFQSPPESIAEYVGKQAPPFPLLGDPQERLYRLYGVEASLAGFVSPKNLPAAARAMALGYLPGRMEGTKTRLPADFLIGPDQRIETVNYADAIGEHIPFEAVERWLAKAA